MSESDYYINFMKNTANDTRCKYRGNEIIRKLNLVIRYQAIRHAKNYIFINHQRDTNQISPNIHSEYHNKIMKSTLVLIKIVILRNRLYKTYIRKIYKCYLSRKRKDIRTISPRKNKKIKKSSDFWYH